MILPPVVTLRVLDSAGRAAQALVFSMRITTGQRNPFNILFPKTDVEGEARLNAEEIVGQFEDCFSEDLMGHYGALSDASQEVVFSLFDVHSLQSNLPLAAAWPLMPYEARTWPSREAKLKYLLSTRNRTYSCDAATVSLPAQGEVQLFVAPRDGA
jgi:hypothetical protein